MSPAKRKRAPREGEGRPARTGNGASAPFMVRLSESERSVLRELSKRLGCSESEAARVAIREAVHERFHERTEPGCALCAEYDRKTRETFATLVAQAPAVNAAIADVSKRAAIKLRRKSGAKS